MKNFPVSFLVLSLALLSAFHSYAATDLSGVPERFRNVEKWSGTITVTESSSYYEDTEYGRASGTHHYTTSYYVSLEMKDPEAMPLMWSAEIGKGHYSYTGHYRYSGGGSINGAGLNLQPTRLQAELALEKDTYGVVFIAELPTQEHVHAGSVNVQRRSSKEARGVSLWHRNAYPKKRMVLSGSDTTTDIRSGPDYKTDTVNRISWNLYPGEAPDLDLEIDPEKYNEWIPKGTNSEKKPGEFIKVHARLKNKKTGKPFKAKQFIFELVDTSKEPGTAMNWPLNGKDDYDFQFQELLNPGFKISNDGQKAETIVSDKIATSDHEIVTVSSYDWGGTTSLTVTAILDDDSKVTGHLKDSGDLYALIPKRSDNSFIADAWKNNTPGATGKNDLDDEETFPENRMEECKDHHGDGLTLYDEYRGFYFKRDPRAEKGHVRGNPEKKDYFTVDNMGDAIPGILAFASMTKLEVHPWVRFDEVKKGVVNFNQGSVTNPVEQHVVEVQRGWSPDSQGVSFVNGSGPGTPGALSRVLIAPQLTGSDLLRTIPHELLHASNVWHHGDTDLQRVYWQAKPYQGKQVIVERKKKTDQSGKIVLVYEESDTVNQVPASNYDYTIPMYVARRHGQHSGNENCVMRYRVADAYDPSLKASYIRYILPVKPQPGYGLCETPQAKGKDLERFGDADVDHLRGACRYQICVNDKYMKSHVLRFADDPEEKL